MTKAQEGQENSGWQEVQKEGKADLNVLCTKGFLYSDPAGGHEPHFAGCKTEGGAWGVRNLPQAMLKPPFFLHHLAI